MKDIPQTYKNLNEPTPSGFPPQHQDVQPGSSKSMNPEPIYDNTNYKGCDKLSGKTVIITGGDSGIGRAVAIAFAKEKATIVIAYLDNPEDADETVKIVQQYGSQILSLKCNLKCEDECNSVIQQTIDKFGRLDILINNIAVQFPQNCICNITKEQLSNTFETNIYSYFFMVKAALPHLQSGSCIINTTSVVAYKGNPKLIDYSSTKGAIVSFTRSLSELLVDRGIRVNAVAPGPVWTPLIPSSFNEQEVSTFGQDTPLKRAAQPFELAPTYVYLASDDSAYVTGQVLHVNGGIIVS